MKVFIRVLLFVVGIVTLAYGVYRLLERFYPHVVRRYYQPEGMRNIYHYDF